MSGKWGVLAVMTPTVLHAVPRLLLTGRRTSQLSAALGEAVAGSSTPNAFNPSFTHHDGSDHIVFRGAARDSAGGPFRALHLHRRSATSAWELDDLTARCATHGVPVVADPKLVVLGSALYATFNTGFHADQNDVFLMRLSPAPGPPQRCIVQPRHRVEKNWGFFEDDGCLKAIYSLTPLRLLTLESGEPGSRGDLHFTHMGTTDGGDHVRGLSQGTQPVRRGHDLVLVAHEKVYWRGRRGYFGRPVTIRDDGDVVVGPHRLAHSLGSLRPPAERHNPNLMFATYFSGLTLVGASALVGYGINDVRCGFAALEVDRLWR